MFYVYSYIYSNQKSLIAVLDTSDYVLEFIDSPQFNLLRQSKIKLVDFECSNVPNPHSGHWYFKDCTTYLDFEELVRYNNIDINSLYKNYKDLHLHCKQFIKKDNFLGSIQSATWHIIALEGNKYTISNDTDGSSFKVTKQQLKSIQKRGDNVIFEPSTKLGNGDTIIDYKQIASPKAKVNYGVLVFFNRLILELSEIPEEIERLVNCLNTNKSYHPEVGGSRYDYAMGLASDYNDIKKYLPPKEFYKVYFGEDSSYTKLFSYMQNISNLKRNGGSANKDDYLKLLDLCGLPIWFLPRMKEELYCLSY